MNDKELYKIDVEEIIRSKVGSNFKYIPSFVVTWLRKLLHEDDNNYLITVLAKDKVGKEWLDECLSFLKMENEVRGLDALPDNSEGKYYTFVSNHPMGGIDGVALGSILCHKYDSRIKYLVNDVLMNLHGLAPLCVPINKTGSQSRDFPKMVDAAFGSDNNILMFPAGLCSRKMPDGSIRDLQWTKTFIVKSVKYHRDIIPIHFSGHNSDKFYNIANWSKKLGLKFNLAMLFLVDEMYKNVGQKFTVTFGQPIPWQTFDSSKTSLEWAQIVKEKVYELDK
ncbi:MAG: glycerol acyltransferase [Prevotellaceae bacterium]|nr:glycerol acyltransferase [Candidatus Colivivens equi]